MKEHNDPRDEKQKDKKPNDPRDEKSNDSKDEKPNDPKNEKSNEIFKNYKCKKCRVIFKSKKDLDRHTYTVKDCVGVLYTCKRCLALFDAIFPLRQHQLREDECVQYIFQNKVSLHNRVVSKYNIRDMGFRTYIQELITPISVVNENQKSGKKSEQIQNVKLIKLVFDSLTNEEFIDVIRFAGIDYPDNKLNLLCALHSYLPHASPEKAKIIQTYYDETHISSF